MIKPPKVALFRSDDSEFAHLQSLFARHDYELHLVSSPSDAIQLMSEQGISFEVIVLGPTVGAGVSGVSTCLTVKADQLLSPIPVVVVEANRDMATLQSLYGAGADMVIPASVSADALYFQICSLARMKRAFDERLSLELDATALRGPLIQALHVSREGLVIFDADSKPVFANYAAQLLLGLSQPPTFEELDSIAPPLQRLLASVTTHPSAVGTILLSNLTRLDSQVFEAAVRVVPLLDSQGASAGCVCGFTDASERINLSNLLVQAQRTRSLSLLAAAGAMKFLRSVYSEVPVSPLSQLEILIEQEPLHSSLGRALTSLLEVLDLVITPGIEVKVKLLQEWRVALRFSHLFQLLGHIILHAVDHAGVGGETIISAESTSHPDTVLLVISSESQRITPSLPNDYLSEILSGIDAESMSGQEKLLRGLHAAQHIADRYSRVIEYKKNDLQLKIRIGLPLVLEE